MILISVLLTRTLFTSIHVVQSFLSETLHSVVYSHKKMPACPHLISLEDVNLEEIGRKMAEVSITERLLPFEMIIYALSW